MANSEFGDYYSISQGREIDLSPNETKGIIYKLYYKFSSVLGGYYLSNRGNKLYITHPWVYFVCQLHRRGADFYTPTGFGLSCVVKKGDNEYTIDIFNDKAHGKYIGYNYEGDTALIAFRIDAAYFKGVDEIVSFTPTINGVGGPISKIYTISNQQQPLLKSLYWNDDNTLKSITYTSDINKTQVLIQDWYDAYNVGLSSYYKDGTKSYKYYNRNFYFFFNQARYLSSSNITPNKANFYYLDNGVQQVLTTELTSSTLNSRNILIDDEGKQVNFNKITVTFISKAKDSSGEVFLEKEIPIEEDLSFKHYSYAFNDLQKTGIFQLKNPVNIERNNVTLLSKIAYTIQIPEDFPYDFTDATLAFKNSSGGTVVDVVITKDKIKIDKTEAVIITPPSTGTDIKINVTYSNGSDNTTTSIFSNGAHTLGGSILNRFTEDDDNETVFSIEPEFNKEYILMDGINYQIKTSATTTNESGNQVTNEVNIPGRVLLSGEYIDITQTTDITQWIIDTETLSLINNCTSIDFPFDCKMKSSQDLYDLGETETIVTKDSTDDTLKYNYNTLNPNLEDKNLTYFISLEPILSAELKNDDDTVNTVTVKTYNELFTIGRLATPVVDESFIPKFEGNILKYSLTEYGGDKNNYYDSDFFINSRLAQTKYFSLSRYPSSEANEKLTIEFFEKDGDSYKTPPSGSCTAKITTDTALEQILSSFRENMIGELDLSTIMSETPWTSLIGKTVKIKVSYYYEKDNYRKDLIVFELLNIAIQSGSRSLGLRKNGIIVAPTEQKEDLPLGTSQRINLKTQLSSDNTKRNGTALEVRVCDAAGTPLQNGDEEITCTIEYRNDNVSNNGAGAFYFDGVNVSELKNTVGNSSAGLVKKVGDLETTVGDSDSGLVKSVNDNKSDIANLKGLQIFTITQNKIGKSDNEPYKEGDAYTQSATLTDARIKSTSICIPIASIDAENSESAARKTATCQAYSATPSDGQCNVGYITGAYDYGGGKWYVQIMLIVINLPSNVTSSTNLETTSIDGTEENIELNTDEE